MEGSYRKMVGGKCQVTEYISVAIATLGFLASVYYSNKNGKKQDLDEAVRRANGSQPN